MKLEVAIITPETLKNPPTAISDLKINRGRNLGPPLGVGGCCLRTQGYQSNPLLQMSSYGPVRDTSQTHLLSSVKLAFHVTDTDILADYRARIVARMSGDFPVLLNTHEDPRRLVRHARFSSRGCARVHMYTCTVHDKLSCTRLQNYTIGASLMSVSVEFQL